MILETEEQYNQACEEYESIKDLDEQHDRKIELANAINEYESRPEFNLPQSTNDYDDELGFVEGEEDE